MNPEQALALLQLLSDLRINFARVDFENQQLRAELDKYRPKVEDE